MRAWRSTIAMITLILVGLLFSFKVRTIRLGGLYWICLFSKLSGHFVSQMYLLLPPLSSYPRWELKTIFPLSFYWQFSSIQEIRVAADHSHGSFIPLQWRSMVFLSYYRCRQTKQTMRRCYCYKSDLTHNLPPNIKRKTVHPLAESWEGKLYIISQEVWGLCCVKATKWKGETKSFQTVSSAPFHAR